jgi:archaellum component FlaD/FlaE
MDLSTLYTKVQPGEGYMNMRASEYLAMDPDEEEQEDEEEDEDEDEAITKVDPQSGKAHYLNQNVLSAKSPEQEKLMATHVDMVDECRDKNKNNTPPRSLPTKNPGGRDNSTRSNGSAKPRLRQPEDKNGDVLAKSTGSSGFQSDYNAVPPHYSAVIQDSGTSEV